MTPALLVDELRERLVDGDRAASRSPILVREAVLVTPDGRLVWPVTS